MKNFYTLQRKVFSSFFLTCLFISFNAVAQVGIGTTEPKTTLDVAGALSLREGPALTIGNGINIDLGETIYSQYSIVDPMADFSVSTFLTPDGISAADGQLLTLINTTTRKMTIVHNQGSNSQQQRRIYCPNETDFVLNGQNTTVTLQYNTSVQRWVVVGTASATKGFGKNVYNKIGDNNINTISTSPSYMEDMSITFTPKNSVVYVNFSASGTMDKGTNFDSNAYANFQLRKDNTTIAGTTTLATDRGDNNSNSCHIVDFPYFEAFEFFQGYKKISFDCFNVEYINGQARWGISHGLARPNGGGANNLVFGGRKDRVTKLITPTMDLTNLDNPELSFWHQQDAITIFGWPLPGTHAKLKVYYRVSETDSWILLHHFSSRVENWTLQTFSLPNPSSSYQLAFEGIGVGENNPALLIDDIKIEGDQPVSGDSKILETAWNAGLSMYPVDVVPGVETTLEIYWSRDGNNANTLRNNVVGESNRSHRNLTIFD